MTTFLGYVMMISCFFFFENNRNCKFMCLFIAKIWWMIPRVGKSASEIPMETQLLLLEVGQDSVLGVVEDEAPATAQSKFYVLVLAVLDGAFRTTLQGTASNELQFCYQSGRISLKIKRCFYCFF